MADLKISQFANGGAIQDTDEIATNRAGVNTKVFVGTMAAQDADSVNIDGGTIDATVIGGTTPAAGTFTVLTANTSISAPYFSPSTTSGIIGTTTNNNAAAGSVGEYIESSIATGSQVSLTDDTTANITSISLTAGDWDVRAVGYFDGAAGTMLFDGRFSVTTTSATIDSSNGRVVWWPYNGTAFGNGSDASLSIPPTRFSLSGTTTVYLVARGNFSASTLAAYGTISARRVR